MKKKAAVTLFFLAVFLLLFLPAALAETRAGVIFLEGQEEPVEETLYESADGFSFWYVGDRLDAYPGDQDGVAGVIVAALYSDDAMVLSLISGEEAAEYTKDLEESIVDQAAVSRAQVELYLEEKDGRCRFCTLIAENGRCLRALGEYAPEAAEGNAKFFQRVLDSVSFTAGCPFQAEWGTETPDEAGFAQVLLMPLQPVKDAALLRLDWSGTDAAYAPDQPLGDLDAGQPISITLAFIGDLPNNGIQYTDEAGVTHAYALDVSGEDGRLIFWKLEE